MKIQCRIVRYTTNAIESLNSTYEPVKESL